VPERITTSGAERTIPVTRYGFVSTYPPTRCGLATFTEALADALVRPRDQAVVVRVLDAPETQPEPVGRLPVSAHLVAGDAGSVAAAVVALDRCDVAIVQHEYGIYGGRDGEEVLAVLRRLSTPVVAVLHTVLVSPSPHQRDVLTAVCALADAVVVMTGNARERLLTTYGVGAAAIRVIPHGVATPARRTAQHHHDRKRIVTWGLIGPGKGVEWAIRALPLLRDLRPAIEYVVAGQTHPKVLARSGEAYRGMLAGLVAELGLSGSVRLDGRYLDPPQLRTLVGSADVVLLPYDSREQATSGVLAEAVAAGLPVVATRFPHAIELLADGSGVLVEQGDAASIAAGLRTVLTGSGREDAVPRGGVLTSWAAAAAAYRALVHDLAAARAA
jgi:glycosyltransferase involved in cell wall biosynthesis